VKNGARNSPAAAQEAVARARAVQRRAADPQISAVLRAAAGAGKTRVLVDRFVRLCLASASPRAILTVTFTRRAAVEIQERLLHRVRRYALLPPRDLRSELTDLLERPPTGPEEQRARGLHAELLEDLSGLHVGTIHSFCQRLLGRFAAEIGLDPHFRVLEHEQELWDEALIRLQSEVATDGAARRALAALGNGPAQAKQSLCRLREDRVHLERWLERVKRAEPQGPPSGSPQGSPPDRRPARRRQPLPGGASGGRRVDLLPALERELREALLADADPALPPRPQPVDLAVQASGAIERLCAALPSVRQIDGQPTPALGRQIESMVAGLRPIGQALAGLAPDEEATGEDEILRRERVFADLVAQANALVLTRAGRVHKLRGSKSLAAERQRAMVRALVPWLEMLDRLGRVRLYDRNVNLLRFGLRALDIYDELKHRDRCVDFQDLERLAWSLLNGEHGPQVQYRLDEKIDHLLVDEFQDTNRNQWEILRPFAEEFLAGGSARGAGRSVFLVGDVKQSIYAWRGAEPALLAEVSGWLTRQADAPALTLPTNFRSLPAIVGTAGRLLNCGRLPDLLPPGEACLAVQAAARAEGPGEVVFLPPFGADGESGEADPERAAARAAVQIVRHLCSAGQIPDNGRRPRYGDILVLMRSRTSGAVYEQAFREAGIPIVPSGRGQLAASREVRDMLCLLRWLVYPDDDAALAGVMRSPLLRVPEPVFQRALAGRGRGSLWAGLRRLAGELGLRSEVALLERWRERLGFEGAHELLRRIYHDGHATERFAGALGEQARYNLLRLHDLALGPASGEGTTLRRLGAAIQRAAESSTEEEATPPEQAEGRVRFMTVHQAKGLEAPVVLLVDAARPLREDVDRVSLGADGPRLYDLRRSDHEPPWLGDLHEAGLPPPGTILGAAAAAARTAQLAEQANILYVAITRARDRLYVLGAEPGTNRRGTESHLGWLQEAAAAAASRPPAEHLDPTTAAALDGPPYRLDPPPWLAGGPVSGEDRRDPAPETAAGASGMEGTPGPGWASWHPAPQRPLVKIISPSGLAGGRARGGATGGSGAGDRDGARAHGTEVHRWLQAACEAGEMGPGSGPAHQEAEAVFLNPTLAWIFHPERGGGRGWSEVPFILWRSEGAGPRTGGPPSRTATRGRGPQERLLGQIDRLILRPDPEGGAARADIVDFKSDVCQATAGEIGALVERYRPQLEAYREAVAAIHPGRAVHLWLLLTHPHTTTGRGVLVPV
jgi:ATP-dependent helicase/nuclease subunit A